VDRFLSGYERIQFLEYHLQVHLPSGSNGPLPTYSIALVGRAIGGRRVVIYAGAGVSVAKPTDLPSGTALAETIYSRLITAFPALSGVDQTNLVDVADVVSALEGGRDALCQAAANAADFTSAKPSYGHQVLAYLVLEGLVDVLTTNWDTCIERGAAGEPLDAVLDDQSLLTGPQVSVLKVHGCASQPHTLLINSNDLKEPPKWVREQTSARLGSAVVIFLGIGDVADYVSQRIDEAIKYVGGVSNIRVVSPGIKKNWDKSKWASVAPKLADNHRIEATSDGFMESLGAAYVMTILRTHELKLQDDDVVHRHIAKAVNALLPADPLSLLRWIRDAAVNAKRGESVLRASETAEALAALGCLAQDGPITFGRSRRVLTTDKGLVELLLATGTISASKLEQEASNRSQRYLQQGEMPPSFLIAGGIGWGIRDVGLPSDVMHEVDKTDIVDGSFAARPTILLAGKLLAA
jgi:hypothetical protein